VNNDLPERRDERGMSQADLAAAVGVSRQTINAIERDRYDPSLELAFDLAAEFDCGIEDIFAPGESSSARGADADAD
jgi:putative transcriptional regulator